MTVRVICFYQPGCMGCMEQDPVNREVEKALGITIEEIDAVENPQYIREYQLKVTPTLIILVDSMVRDRFEGFVHAETLIASLKKYL